MRQLTTKLFVIFVFIHLSTLVSSQIGWVGNMYPNQAAPHTISQGDDFFIYIQVYKSGVTEGSGQGAGITCQIHYGKVINFGDDWTDVSQVEMSYNTDIGNNDEYFGNLSPLVGNYEFTCRCSDDGGGNWSWPDNGENGDGELIVDVTTPLLWESISAAAKGKSISLNWTLIQNTSSFGDYLVERSADMKTWSLVKSKEALLESQGKLSYTFADNKPLNGTNFYRIKLLNPNGTYEYSRIVSARLFNDFGTIFPNPANDYITIQSENQSITSISILDNSGRIIIQLKEGRDNLKRIDLSNLSPGMYFLQYETEGNQSQFNKFIKE